MDVITEEDEEDEGDVEDASSSATEEDKHEEDAEDAGHPTDSMDEVRRAGRGPLAQKVESRYSSMADSVFSVVTIGISQKLYGHSFSDLIFFIFIFVCVCAHERESSAALLSFP